MARPIRPLIALPSKNLEGLAQWALATLIETWRKEQAPRVVQDDPVRKHETQQTTGDAKELEISAALEAERAVREAEENLRKAREAFRDARERVLAAPPPPKKEKK